MKDVSWENWILISWGMWSLGDLSKDQLSWLKQRPATYKVSQWPLDIHVNEHEANHSIHTHQLKPFLDTNRLFLIRLFCLKKFLCLTVDPCTSRLMNIYEGEGTIDLKYSRLVFPLWSCFRMLMSRWILLFFSYNQCMLDHVNVFECMPTHVGHKCSHAHMLTHTFL